MFGWGWEWNAAAVARRPCGRDPRWRYLQLVLWPGAPASATYRVSDMDSGTMAAQQPQAIQFNMAHELHNQVKSYLSTREPIQASRRHRLKLGPTPLTQEAALCMTMANSLNFSQALVELSSIRRRDLSRAHGWAISRLSQVTGAYRVPCT
jgi:hypothetical protein